MKIHTSSQYIFKERAAVRSDKVSESSYSALAFFAIYNSTVEFEGVTFRGKWLEIRWLVYAHAHPSRAHVHFRSCSFEFGLRPHFTEGNSVLIFDNCLIDASFSN